MKGGRAWQSVSNSTKKQGKYVENMKPTKALLREVQAVTLQISPLRGNLSGTDGFMNLLNPRLRQTWLTRQTERMFEPVTITDLMVWLAESFCTKLSTPSSKG